jgi:hypothetical protein
LGIASRTFWDDEAEDEMMIEDLSGNGAESRRPHRGSRTNGAIRRSPAGAADAREWANEELAFPAKGDNYSAKV